MLLSNYGAVPIIGIVIVPIFIYLQSLLPLPASIENCSTSIQVYLPLVDTSTQSIPNATSPDAAAQPPAQLAHNSASWGAPIAISPEDEFVWVANPDSGSVSVVDAATNQRVAEIPFGQEPWSLAIAPDGEHVYVADRATGQLTQLDAASHTLLKTMFVGPELGTIALTPNGNSIYVTVMATSEVVVVDTRSFEIAAHVEVAALPYAVGITNDGDNEDDDEQVLVTHLAAFKRSGGEEARNDGRAGKVTVLDSCANEIISEMALLPNENGFPNLLTGIGIYKHRAWIALVRAMPDLPSTLTQTVFAAVSTLDLDELDEDTQAALPLNDQDIFGSPVNNPMAAVPSPDGQRLYVVLAGSDLVEVVDISNPHSPTLIGFIPVANNPRGIAISADGKRGYVMNYLARSVTVLDLETLTAVDEVVVTDEVLDDDVLLGKLLFHNAVNPKLSRGSWISCASCHFDGGTDSVTWIFPDGPRQTPPLWNSIETLPWHWSAALDEPHDVEETIHLIQHGLGLAPGEDQPLLAEPNAGRSEELDALVAFMAHGIRVPALASAENDFSAGRDLFVSAGCADCHGGDNWTSSALPGAAGTLDPDGNGMVDDVLRKVGTLNPRDLRGATGFDPPSLLGVGLTAPYFHDGSMPSLADVLRSGHPDPLGGNGLTEAEIDELVKFLQQIDGDTEPVTLIP